MNGEKSLKLLWLDFETFGEDVLEPCAAIDMSVIVGNTEKMLSDNPYTCKDVVNAKKFKLSVADQVQNYGFVVQESAMKFWQEVSPEARKHIKPSPTDLKVDQFATQFVDYLNGVGKIDYWFTRGNAFDPIILQRMFKVLDKTAVFKEYLKYHKVQDMRTHINAKLDYPITTNICPIQDEDFWKKVFVEHSSDWDVLADLLRYQTILRLENDLEQPMR
jgi:hypothetical protein